MSTRNVHYFLLTLILILACVAGWLGWMLLQPPSTDQGPLSFTEDEGNIFRPGRDIRDNDTDGLDSFDLPDAPELINPTITDAPSYFYLFTHTEDPFNHELSEERYWRIGAMVEELTAPYPDLNFTWTIEFQGSDAKTIADRNEETGLVDYLLDLHAQDLIEFGYHAHHDPTYNNRPQNDLSSSSTFEETYDVLYTWITCEKDLFFGGCTSERGGGLEMILDVFGEVEIVTGLGIADGVQIERSAGSMAVSSLLPDRYLGFGISDHGPGANDPEFQQQRDALLHILTPTSETSSATYWQDNIILINDNSFLEGVATTSLKDGVRNLISGLEAVDGSRSHVINEGIASKYLYTATGTSPTIWGYAHPESPELPDEYLLSTRDKEKAYQQTELGLAYMIDLVANDPEHWKFVNSDEVVDLFTSEDYWHVTETELEQIAAWLLHEWTDAPSNWTYDGEDFYSLTDTFALLVSGLQNTYPETGLVSTIGGPWSRSIVETEETRIYVDDLMELLSDGLIQDNRIAETYQVGNETLTSTQVLYALAYEYLANQEGIKLDSIVIPATMTAPVTYDYLEAIGCQNCLDSSWSLKPARFQD